MYILYKFKPRIEPCNIFVYVVIQIQIFFVEHTSQDLHYMNQISTKVPQALTLTPAPDTIVLKFFWASTNPDLKFAYASLCA